MKTAKRLTAGILILSCFPSLMAAFAASSVQDRRQPIKKPTLAWIHKETGRKIFGLDDIIAFDWDKQMFELKEEAAMNMYLYPVGLIDPFEVRCDNEIIYEGAFVGLECSIPYKGPVIPDTYRFSESHSSLFQIVNGYPDEKYSVDYAHYTPPVKQILSEAGLLKVIDPNNPTVLIPCRNHGWIGEKSGLRVWLDIFPNTFVPGMPARFHFRLTSQKQYPEDDYIIETRTTLTGNSGRYTRTASRVFPVSQKYLWATHPVGLVLSAVVKDGKWERIEAGPAQLGMEIAVCRVLDQKAGSYSEPIETLKTEPITIDIQSPKHAELPPEAKTAMDDFRKALQKEDWPKALPFCSETVQQKANVRPLQEFFKTYTPLEKLTGAMEYNVCGTSTNAAQQANGFECFITLSKPDEQPSLNWVWKLRKNEKENTWSIAFPLIPVTEQMESEKNRLTAEQLKAREREQLLRKNMKTTLVPILDEYVIGKPMLFRLEVSNVSDSVMTVPYFSNSFMENDPLSVRGPDGKDVLYIGGSAQTVGGQKDFGPGQTEIPALQYDVTTQYLIIRPGEYTFQFRGESGFPASQEIKLDIQPGSLSPREEITTRILSVMPEDWTISGARALSRKSAKADTHLNLMAYMDIAGMGFYGRMVLLVFIDPDEKTPADYDTLASEFEKLGQSSWGPVYTISNNADLYWPDYRESLLRALSIQTEE